MIVSVIDIGTNTVLLLVAKVEPSLPVTPLAHEQRVPRLGKGVDANRNLDHESMRRVARVLEEYRTLLTPFAPDRVVVCGTSAVRDAGNREAFAELIRRETGFDLQVLSGEEEALWTYRGAVSGFAGLVRATVVDIGGGSTEITVGDRQSPLNAISLNVGSVRITERFFRHDPPTHPELEAAIGLIEDELARAARFPFAGSTCIAVAGTATTLALLAQGLASFDIAAVTNYPMSRDVVEDLFRKLRAMASPDIRGLSRVMEGRHDVITAGALILREVMAHFRFDEVIVSERGVRYGLAIREAERVDT
jgi:exopolyphosphatase/guanosine-5'-triphosphate,3'-diphosphate pyrophosphatase